MLCFSQTSWSCLGQTVTVTSSEHGPSRGGFLWQLGDAADPEAAVEFF
jgi:hypothetical protein